MIKISFLLAASLALSSCITPLPELSEEAKQVLFIKDHIPEDNYNCQYLGLIQYSLVDNPDGLVLCAHHDRQSWAFLKKAGEKHANLVVANFSRNNRDLELKGDQPSCDNQAKIFRCPASALETLKKYE